VESVSVVSVVEVVSSVIGSVTVKKVVATLDAEIASSTPAVEETNVLLLEVVTAVPESKTDITPVLFVASPLEASVTVLVGVIVT